MRRTLVLLALALAPAASGAASYSRVHLVPALAACAGPATCPRQLESAFTFDTISLRTPSSKYTPADKPSFILDVRGVRDPGGALVNGTLTLKVLSGRVSLPSLGTFPDDSPLTQVAPVAVPLKNGGASFPYRAPATPNGLIQNGGGVEVLDPTGKRLAVTGAQSRP